MNTERPLRVASRPAPASVSTASAWQVLHSAIAFTADRLAPASFFLLFLITRGTAIAGLLGQLETASGTTRWHLYADIANSALVCLFLATIAVLYLLRRPAIRKINNPWQRAVALGASFGTSVLVFAPTTLPDLSISLAASALIVIGEAIAIVGLFSLRGCFGILPEVRGLVTSGIYRHVRHPLYLGESIASIGIALPVLSPVAGAILGGYFLLQWRRALNEEALLASTFAEYRDYARRTGQFVPFITRYRGGYL